MNKLLYILILLILCGCSTKKKITENLDAEQIAYNISQKESISKIDSIIKSISDISILETTDFDRQIDIIKYDLDKQKDSIGNYPIKEKITISDKSKNKKETKEDKKVDINISKQDNTIQKDSLNINTKIKQKTTEEKKTTNYTSVYIILLVVILVILFLWYIKNKIKIL